MSRFFGFLQIEITEDNFMIFLSLHGSWYDVGYQHGEKLKCLIHSAIRKYCRFFSVKQSPNKEVLWKHAETLQADFPELMEEMKGIADGAGCSIEDILIYNLSPLLSSCSNLVFVCNGEPMLGHINDDSSAGVFDVAFHIFPNRGSELLYIGLAGSVGVGAAINSEGLAISHACARSEGLKNINTVLSLSLLRRVLINRSRNCQEAESFLLNHSFVSGADNIIGVNKAGAAFVAEKLPIAVEFRHPDRGVIYCTGRSLTSKIRRIVNQEVYEKKAPEIRKLIAREQYFDSTLTEHMNNLSLELMKKILCCTEEGIEICNELSNWAAILLPKRFEMLIADRFPCNNIFKRFT